MVKIEDLQVKEGKPAKFVVKATGEPAPQITWFHDHKPITDSEVYRIRYPEEGESTLLLPESLPEDTGVYTAKASNEVSEVECSATLDVTGRNAFFSLSRKKISIQKRSGIINHVW